MRLSPAATKLLTSATCSWKAEAAESTSSPLMLTSAMVSSSSTTRRCGPIASSSVKVRLITQSRIPTQRTTVSLRP